MHCLLHLNESLNLEDFLSLSHLKNAFVGPFWSFNYQDRNDRFPTLSYASNNEIPIFLKPVKGTPFVRSSPSVLLKETIFYSKKHGTEWLIYSLVSSCKNNCKIYVNYIPYFLKK